MSHNTNQHTEKSPAEAEREATESVKAAVWRQAESDQEAQAIETMTDINVDAAMQEAEHAVVGTLQNEPKPRDVTAG